MKTCICDFQVFLSCFIFLVIVGALAIVCNSFVLFLFIKHKSVGIAVFQAPSERWQRESRKLKEQHEDLSQKDMDCSRRTEGDCYFLTDISINIKLSKEFHACAIVLPATLNINAMTSWNRKWKHIQTLYKLDFLRIEKFSKLSDKIRSKIDNQRLIQSICVLFHFLYCTELQEKVPRLRQPSLLSISSARSPEADRFRTQSLYQQI